MPVKVFAVRCRPATAHPPVFDKPMTVTAPSNEEAVHLFCKAKGLKFVDKYGSYIWRAKGKGHAAYLIRCDRIVSGRERKTGA